MVLRTIVDHNDQDDRKVEEGVERRALSTLQAVKPDGACPRPRISQIDLRLIIRCRKGQGRYSWVPRCHQTESLQIVRALKWWTHPPSEPGGQGRIHPWHLSHWQDIPGRSEPRSFWQRRSHSSYFPPRREIRSLEASQSLGPRSRRACQPIEELPQRSSQTRSHCGSREASLRQHSRGHQRTELPRSPIRE